MILRDVDLTKSTVKIISEEKDGVAVQVVGQGARIKLTLSKEEQNNGTFYQIIAILMGKE